MASKAKPAISTRSSTRTKPTTQPTTTTAARITRAAATKSTAPAPSTTTKKVTAARKPLLNRNASPEITPAVAKKPAAKTSKLVASNSVSSNSGSDADKEPIRAYLRIRPHLGDDSPTSSPYLEPLSDTAVRMTDPSQPSQDNQLHRVRLSAAAPSSIYTFSHVFPTSTPQSEFFTQTTLPLVQDLLDGQNGLLFAYGVTNSGKTYTVQGGNEEGGAGILPRTLDVIFNSIEGLHAKHRYRPVRLQGIEEADLSSTPHSTPAPPNEPALADVLAAHVEDPTELDIDPTVLKLDRNYEYSVWLSYTEVYNEKVYDLLHTVNCSSEGSKTIRPSFVPALANGGGGNTNSLLLTRKALPVKPSPASDSGDTISQGKYVAGLRQIQVNSAAEAKALVKLGQLHRRVFGTLANSQSSRSHGMVTIKILRNHRGERNDPTAYQTSRLTLVDLAGSERTKYTHTTGDRLKEAGNINKSLMVLGQCMQVLRANQRRVAQTLQAAGRSDTRDTKRAMAVVPFRHSKLTEILMDYFVGEGKAVMIVNVNPYDTGYDENSHVMKFAAAAREVCTNPVPAPLHRAPSPMKRSQQKPTQTRPGLHGIGFAPNRRKVTLSSVGVDRKVSKTQLEIVEEDEEVGEPGEDEEEEPLDPMVDALFEEIDILRLQLVEAHLRCAMIEAETREEVMKEMDERMRDMEQMFTRRLMNEIARNEMKTDAKIDMLHRAGAFGKAPQPQSSQSKREEVGDSEGGTSEMDDVENSLVRGSASTVRCAFDSCSINLVCGRGRCRACIFCTFSFIFGCLILSPGTESCRQTQAISAYRPTRSRWSRSPPTSVGGRGRCH
ncbi:kinesin-domain-containing protein [Neolentinus lepideus HHB14362 ss-1]|uniref:Kinesin-like protein n=1 Tax=Neolentinus lepideus HHB14362 ss-1 TaxID=1314782 RepID=A0A165RID2_9AGAM|nr:kinesin-domain-containing protein [Neolentinus lepideus HHB14362 ss-1]